MMSACSLLSKMDMSCECVCVCGCVCECEVGGREVEFSVVPHGVE